MLEPDLTDVFRILAGFSVSYLGRGALSLIVVWEIFVASENRLAHVFEYVLGFVAHVWLVQAGYLSF